MENIRFFSRPLPSPEETNLPTRTNQDSDHDLMLRRETRHREFIQGLGYLIGKFVQNLLDTSYFHVQKPLSAICSDFEKQIFYSNLFYASRDTLQDLRTKMQSLCTNRKNEIKIPLIRFEKVFRKQFQLLSFTNDHFLIYRIDRSYKPGEVFASLAHRRIKSLMLKSCSRRLSAGTYLI